MQVATALAAPLNWLLTLGALSMNLRHATRFQFGSDGNEATKSLKWTGLLEISGVGHVDR